MEHAAAPCLSVIIPLPDARPQNKKQIVTQIRTTLQQVAESVRSAHPDQADQLIASLQKQLTRFEENYHTGAAGLGIYVSSDDSRQFLFPFPVEEKIHIGNTFFIRELLLLEHYASGYLLLHINGKIIQCYEGRLNELTAISNERFPLEFIDDYEYAKPAQVAAHGGYEGIKSFEKDKSVVKARHRQNFYRKADQQLKDLLNGRPLVIAGPEKDLSLFREITGHQSSIIGEIPGNYTHISLKKLADKCWHTVGEWLDHKDADTVSQLIEKTWPKNIIDGIKNVWRAVQDGRGLKLLVEKNYACPGFVGDKAGKFYLKAPKLAHHTIADAVDDIMKTVLHKKGDVIFADNNALQEHQHIALITRY